MENNLIYQIRTDLRKLKKIQKSIDIYQEVEERHKKRLALLKAGEQTKSAIEDIAKIQEILKNISTSECISRSLAIESKYMSAINKLEPLDKTLILDGYINGVRYRDIGEKLGYSEIGIQKKMSIAIERLAKILSKSKSV